MNENSGMNNVSGNRQFWGRMGLALFFGFTSIFASAGTVAAYNERIEPKIEQQNIPTQPTQRFKQDPFWDPFDDPCHRMDEYKNNQCRSNIPVYNPCQLVCRPNPPVYNPCQRSPSYNQWTNQYWNTGKRPWSEPTRYPPHPKGQHPGL